MKAAQSRHEARILADAKAAFVAWRGFLDACVRAEQIATLPTVTWKGRTLYTLTCAATFGRGPHKVNVPESVLWTLIDLRAFRCAYH